MDIESLRTALLDLRTFLQTGRDFPTRGFRLLKSYGHLLESEDRRQAQELVEVYGFLDPVPEVPESPHAHKNRD